MWNVFFFQIFFLKAIFYYDRPSIYNIKGDACYFFFFVT